MCGLVAIISKNKAGFFQQDKTIYLQMLISDMFRGMDSTGCFGINKYGNLKMIKDASSASYFIGKKDTGEFLSKFVSDFHCVVGHNRKATMGNVVSENAHPFIEGNICLVHNGTLTNHYKLANTTVDSHAICKHISEHGYKSMFKNIEGAYALIWYNAEEKMVYFARNAERPLYFVETADKIYLASEDKMLDWILDRNNISKYTIQNVPTDKVFKFNMETRSLECETKPKKESVSKQTPQQQTPHWVQQITPKRQKHFSKPHLVACSDSSSQGNLIATIETYTTGELLAVKVVDFDINEVHTKLILETMDGLNTPCTMYLPHTKYTQREADAFINAARLFANVTTITTKKGIVSLFLRDIQIPEEWTTRDNSKVDPADLAATGGACFACGVVLDKEKDVEFAEIQTDASGNITYILCEHCADQVEHVNAYRGTYNGHC